MKRFVLLLSLLFVCIISNANEVVSVDNMEIQQYKGVTGKWTLVTSTANLNSLVQKFDTTITKVREINQSLTMNDYLFIPYSDKYLKELEDKGIVRSSIESNENDFIWPLPQVESISSPYGMRCGQLHTGADMPASKGTPILAAMDGRVVFTGYAGGHGKTIYLEHRDNFFTRYSHCSVMLVKNGDFVKKGQIVGLVGSSGRSTGNHLHFEIRYKDVPLNPLDFLPFKESLKNAHQLRNWK